MCRQLSHSLFPVAVSSLSLHGFNAHKEDSSLTAIFSSLISTQQSSLFGVRLCCPQKKSPQCYLLHSLFSFSCRYRRSPFTASKKEGHDCFSCDARQGLLRCASLLRTRDCFRVLRISFSLAIVASIVSFERKRKGKRKMLFAASLLFAFSFHCSVA